MQNLLLPSWGNRPRDGVDLPVAALWFSGPGGWHHGFATQLGFIAHPLQTGQTGSGRQSASPPTCTGLPEHTALTLSRFSAGASRGGGVRAKLWGRVTGGNALSSY